MRTVWIRFNWVASALSAKGTFWFDRAVLFLGALRLFLLPVEVGQCVWHLASGEVMQAAGDAALAAMAALLWGHAWRLAIDVPMGSAWWKLRSIQWGMVGCYAVAGIANAFEGDWFNVAVDLFGIKVFWPGGNGGDGWDDPVDAPKPDPAASA